MGPRSRADQAIGPRAPFPGRLLPCQDETPGARAYELNEASSHELSAAALWIESASTGSGVASIISLVPAMFGSQRAEPAVATASQRGAPAKVAPTRAPDQPPYAFEDCGGSLRRCNASMARSLRQFVPCVAAVHKNGSITGRFSQIASAKLERRTGSRGT